MAFLAVLGAGTSYACVGNACMQIWSAQEGGGRLAVQWDFTQNVQTGLVLCVGVSCFYSTIDPGFMAPPDDVPGDSYFRLADGTDVTIEIVSVDAGLTLGNVNGSTLKNPGDTGLLGTMPTVHAHSSWQLTVGSGVFGTYQLSYKLTTTSPLYVESEVYTVMVTNVAPVGPTPTATPIPPSDCAADCDADGGVAQSELETCVDIALQQFDLLTCTACDADGDGEVTIDDLIAGVAAKITACPTPAPVTLDEIQATIFTPRCAITTCHDSVSHVEGLDLTGGVSHHQIVNVPSQESPLKRVAPGDPDSSFLYVKIVGPPPLGQGTQMPQTGGPLSAQEIRMVRNWILQGALP